MIRALLPRRPADAIAAVVAIAATAAVLVNALALQPSRHPAPLYIDPSRNASVPIQTKRPVPAATEATRAPAAPVPLARPETAPTRTRPDLVLEIQRELALRGYYDGSHDGRMGPRTEQAIRDFERALGIRQSGEASEGLLAQILRSRVRPDITGSIEKRADPVRAVERPFETVRAIERPVEPVRTIEKTAEPPRSARVLAVQRVLARLGYGPLRLNGTPDAPTRASIERFERDRDLPPSGEISERLVRELVAVTGAPLE